jgi:hypothetical protein
MTQISSGRFIHAMKYYRDETSHSNMEKSYQHHVQQKNKMKADTLTVWIHLYELKIYTAWNIFIVEKA